MKSLCPRYEVIINRLVLLVRQEWSLFPRDLFLHLFKTFFHYRGGCGSILIMNGHLIQPTMKEFSFNGRGLRVGQGSIDCSHLDDAQIRLLAGNRDGEIQGFFRGPGNQFLRRVSPVHTKGRLEKFLGLKRGERQQEHQAGEISNSSYHGTCGSFEHERSLAFFKSFRKPRRLQSGFVLVEATAALSLLSVVGLILLSLTMNVITPRQYSLQQVLSDSYLTFERAQAERIPFDTLVSNSDTLWPEFPDVATEEVEIGRLPGGRVVMGTVIRTRHADESNYPADGGTGTEATNPAAMKIWKVQSVLRYSIANRTYVKSRTVIRAQ